MRTKNNNINSNQNTPHSRITTSIRIQHFQTIVRCVRWKGNRAIMRAPEQAQYMPMERTKETFAILTNPTHSLALNRGCRTIYIQFSSEKGDVSLEYTDQSTATLWDDVTRLCGRFGFFYSVPYISLQHVRIYKFWSFLMKSVR